MLLDGGSAALWTIGQCDDSFAGFDTNPHGEPYAIEFTVGEPDSAFPHTLGTDIGNQRSVINIHSDERLLNGGTLIVHWSPGETYHREKFSVLVDGDRIGESQDLAGSMPNVWLTEQFDVPALSDGDHVITLNHEVTQAGRRGDGLWFDCLSLTAREASDNWPQATGDEIHASVLVADVDSNGDLEVISASDNHYVYVWNHDGSLYPGWPQRTNANWRDAAATPAVGDVDGDGDLEIFVGADAFDGDVHGWHHNGSTITGGEFGDVDGNDDPPVGLADLDDDGKLEVVATSGLRGRRVFAWGSDGSSLPGWPVDVGSVSRGPALNDVDGDGRTDVVAAAGTTLHAFDAAGDPLPGWHRELPSPIDTGSHIIAPAIADLDDDGTAEIVISTTRHVAVHEHDGSVRSGWPRPIGMSGTSPAIGDLDGDGRLEIVVSTGWHWSRPSSTAYVYAFKDDGTSLAGWPKQLGVGISSQPVLGDVDGDVGVEIVVGAHDGQLYAWNADGTEVPGWPKQVGGSIQHSSPVITDLDGDGKTDVLVGSTDGNVYLVQCGSEYNTAKSPWPVHGHDVAQTFAVPYSPVQGPPRLTGMEPTPGTGIGSGVEAIRLRFDRPIETANLWAPSFELSASGGDGRFNDGNEIALEIVDVTWDSDANTVTLVPQTSCSFLPRDTYRLTALDELRDLDGVRLDGEFTGTFPSGNGEAGGPFVATFEITNAPPVASDDRATTVAGSPVGSALAACDADGDDLTFHIRSNPEHGSVQLDPNTGQWEFRPAGGYFGQDAFTFTANDGLADSAPATVTIHVAPQPCDLEPLSIEVTSPERFHMGDTIAVRWNGINHGPGETLAIAGPDWRDRLYLSTDDQLDPSDRYLGTWDSEASPLGQGAGYSASTEVALPEDIEGSGVYYVIVETNPDRRQVETDAGNNWLAAEITVDPYVRLIRPYCGRFTDNQTSLGFRWHDVDQRYSATISLWVDDDDLAVEDTEQGATPVQLAADLPEDPDGVADETRVVLPGLVPRLEPYYVWATLANPDGSFYSEPVPIRVFERAYYSDDAIGDATGGLGFDDWGIEAGILQDTVYYRVLTNFPPTDSSPPPVGRGGDVYINVGGTWQRGDGMVNGIAVNQSTAYRQTLVPEELYTHATFRGGVVHGDRPVFIADWVDRVSGRSSATVTNASELPCGGDNMPWRYQIDGHFELAALPDYTNQSIQLAWSKYCGNDITDVIIPGTDTLRAIAMSPEPSSTIAGLPNEEILVTFNMPPDPETVNEQTVRLLGSGGDGRFDDGNEVSITPMSVTMISPTEAKLDLAGVALLSDNYQLHLLSDITRAVNDTALDGEFPERGTTLDLPSGNGIPGGDFVATFHFTNVAPEIVELTLAWAGHGNTDPNGSPVTGAWHSMPAMPTRRGALGAAVFDDVVYVVGGTVRGSYATMDLPTLEKFDLTTRTWATKAPMPTARSDVDLVAVGDYLYAIGGRSGPDGQVTRRADVERYDPATDTWQSMTPMPTPRNAHATVAYGDKIYVMGGNNGPPNGSLVLAAVEVYDPSTDSWSQTSNMPAPADGITAAVSGDRVYVFGHSVGREIIFEYAPATDTWREITPQNAVLFSHSSAIARDGKVYVMGGHLAGGVSTRAYEYDPSENSLHSLHEMPTPRVNTATVAVPNGVCAVGGFSRYWEGSDSVDCFVFQPPASTRIEEGDSVSLRGIFTDPDAMDEHTVVVDWGDGTTDTLVPDLGQRQFSFTHQYLDDNPTRTPVDRYRIDVTVTDDHAGQDVAATTALVHNTNPSITELTQIDNGASVTIAGSFVDSGIQDEHAVVVQWHDGISDTVVLPLGQRVFSLAHQYVAFVEGGGFFGDDTVIVTVMDDDGGHDTAVVYGGDGVSGDVEGFAPNGGDGNGDGIPDRDQQNVASLPNWADGRYVTFATSSQNTLSAVRTADRPTGDGTQNGIDFPVGFFDFEVGGTANGASITTTVFLPPGTGANTYYRYGPTPDDPTDHWYPFMFDPATRTGAVVYHDRMELHFVDGGRGDNDLIENGAILDPGAPGKREHPWQNPVRREDVTNDGLVTPLDVLVLIADINQRALNNETSQLSAVPASGEQLPPYLDVFGDDLVSPLDVLSVIYAINTRSIGNPEGEALETESSNTGRVWDTTPKLSLAWAHEVSLSAKPPGSAERHGSATSATGNWHGATLHPIAVEDVQTSIRASGNDSVARDTDASRGSCPLLPSGNSHALALSELDHANEELDAVLSIIAADVDAEWG